MIQKSGLIPWVVAATAILGIGFQVYASIAHQPVIRIDQPIDELLPKSIPGWEATELDLGPTERVREQADEILNLDSFYHYQFSKGSLSFTVYLAHWNPGKMPVYFVGSHTPDVCWVSNGMKMLEADHRDHLAVNGKTLITADERVFDAKGQEIFVYYWHMLGDESYRAENEAGRVNSLKRLTNFFEYGFDQRREQIFFRIHSDKPLNRVWPLPEVQDYLAQVVEVAGVVAAKGQPLEGAN